MRTNPHTIKWNIYIITSTTATGMKLVRCCNHMLYDWMYSSVKMNKSDWSGYLYNNVYLDEDLLLLLLYDSDLSLEDDLDDLLYDLLARLSDLRPLCFLPRS